MRANPLSEKGLSMSQAQSIANLCNQRSTEINQQLITFNNATKSVVIDGKTVVMIIGRPVPENLTAIIAAKVSYVSLQAFLMEAIKTKNTWIQRLTNEKFVAPEDLVYPEKERVDYPSDIEAGVGEEWAWEQLTLGEINEFLIMEATASQIGQFIHKDGLLTKLRNEMSTMPDMEWLDKYIAGGITSLPVAIEKHHTSKQLLDLHEGFAQQHREAEMRVNYYKAKIKNLVALRNAEISGSNGAKLAVYNQKEKDASDTYGSALKQYNLVFKQLAQEWEKGRILEIKRISALRIEVPERLQSTVDIFLKHIKQD